MSNLTDFLLTWRQLQHLQDCVPGSGFPQTVGLSPLLFLCFCLKTPFQRFFLRTTSKVTTCVSLFILFHIWFSSWRLPPTASNPFFSSIRVPKGGGGLILFPQALVSTTPEEKLDSWAKSGFSFQQRSSPNLVPYLLKVTTTNITASHTREPFRKSMNRVALVPTCLAACD